MANGLSPKQQVVRMRRKMVVGQAQSATQLMRTLTEMLDHVAEISEDMDAALHDVSYLSEQLRQAWARAVARIEGSNRIDAGEAVGTEEQTEEESNE